MIQITNASKLLHQRLNNILLYNYKNDFYVNRDIISDQDFSKLKILDENSKTLLYTFRTQHTNRLIIDIALKTISKSKKVIFFHICEIEPLLDEILLSLFKNGNLNTIDSLSLLDDHEFHFCKIFRRMNEAEVLETIDDRKPDLIIMDDVNFLLPRQTPNLTLQKIADAHRGQIIMTQRLGECENSCDFIINQFTTIQITKLIGNEIMSPGLLAASFADNILFYEHHSAFKGALPLEERSEYLHILKSKIFEDKKLKLNWQDKLSTYLNSFS